MTTLRSLSTEHPHVSATAADTAALLAAVDGRGDADHWRDAVAQTGVRSAQHRGAARARSPAWAASASATRSTDAWRRRSPNGWRAPRWRAPASPRATSRPCSSPPPPATWCRRSTTTSPPASAFPPRRVTWRSTTSAASAPCAPSPPPPSCCAAAPAWRWWSPSSSSSLWLPIAEPSPADLRAAMVFGDGAGAVVLDASADTARPAAPRQSIDALARQPRRARRRADRRRPAPRRLAAPAARRGRQPPPHGGGVPARPAARPCRPRLRRREPERARPGAGDHLPSRPRRRRDRGAAIDLGAARKHPCGRSLHLLRGLAERGAPRDGDLGLLLAVGPGLTCDLMLLRWHPLAVSHQEADRARLELTAGRAIPGWGRCVRGAPRRLAGQFGCVRDNPVEGRASARPAPRKRGPPADRTRTGWETCAGLPYGGRRAVSRT